MCLLYFCLFKSCNILHPHSSITFLVPYFLHTTISPCLNMKQRDQGWGTLHPGHLLLGCDQFPCLPISGGAELTVAAPPHHTSAATFRKQASNNVFTCNSFEWIISRTSGVITLALLNFRWLWGNFVFRWWWNFSAKATNINTATQSNIRNILFNFSWAITYVIWVFQSKC